MHLVFEHDSTALPGLRTFLFLWKRGGQVFICAYFWIKHIGVALRCVLPIIGQVAHFMVLAFFLIFFQLFRRDFMTGYLFRYGAALYGEVLWRVADVAGFMGVAFCRRLVGISLIIVVRCCELMDENVKKIYADLKAKKFAPVYFLQGEETFYIEYA